MIAFILFLFLAATAAALCLLAYGTRADIEKQDPLYAAALYRSGAERFWARGLPVRGLVLLFTKPASVARSTLFPLQVLYCLYTVLLVSCVLAIVFAR